MADAYAEKMDTLEIHKAELELKHANLLTRLRELLRRLEQAHIEIYSAHDTDMPPAKHAEAEHREQIHSLLSELNKEWTSKGREIKDIAKKLQVIDTRVQSLEVLIPGTANNN